MDSPAEYSTAADVRGGDDGGESGMNGDVYVIGADIFNVGWNVVRGRWSGWTIW